MREIIRRLGDRRASNIERRVTARELELLGRLLCTESTARSESTARVDSAG